MQKSIHIFTYISDVSTLLLVTWQTKFAQPFFYLSLCTWIYFSPSKVFPFFYFSCCCVFSVNVYSCMKPYTLLRFCVIYTHHVYTEWHVKSGICVLRLRN